MSRTNIKNEAQQGRVRLFGTNEDLLSSEIRFWKEMIASNDAAITPAMHERMEQALALAESRLASLPDKYQRVLNNIKSAAGNVYFIDRQSQAQVRSGQEKQDTPD